MKVGKTLQELALEVRRRAGAKKDYVAAVDRFRMTGSQSIQIDGNGDVPLNSIAHGQLAEYTGIPQQYYNKMREMPDHPALLANNVNAWLAHKAREATKESKELDRRLIRTLDGNMRALLSNTYRCIENEDLAEAILPILMDDLDLMIMSCEITERRLYIKAVSKSILNDVPTGRLLGDGSHVFFDTVCPAVTVSNSEVGFGRLLVETGVYTEACTNLAMIGADFKRQHLGARNELSDDVYPLLTDKTKKLTDMAMWAQVQDVVRGAFNEAKFKVTCGKLAGAAQDKITGDVVEVVERFGRHNALNEPVRKSILDQLIRNGDITRYGLHSAVTRTSQDTDDYDQATDLERLGGTVIDMSPREWGILNKIAA